MTAHCSPTINSPLSIRLSGIFAILVLSFLAPQRVEAQPSDSPELNIMSYNIRYGTANDGKNHWRHRKSHLSNLIREQQPDLLARIPMILF